MRAPFPNDKAGQGYIKDVGEIQWVLTVPAIWSDEAKYWMRVWARKGGMIFGGDKSIFNHLIIVYEVDCASIWVMVKSLSLFCLLGRPLAHPIQGMLPYICFVVPLSEKHTFLSVFFADVFVCCRHIHHPLPR